MQTIDVVVLGLVVVAFEGEVVVKYDPLNGFVLVLLEREYILHILYHVKPPTFLIYKSTPHF